TRGHTGRRLSADPATSLIYLLVSLAAITRVAAAFATAWMMPLLILSGGLWIAAFASFVLCYGPMLLGSRPTR
ncbi:MAG TPA: NnrS family protein, partial [Dongiaceae bacterium]|nr:NnrS family protein [Dongiaceae bacterium]